MAVFEEFEVVIQRGPECGGDRVEIILPDGVFPFGRPSGPLDPLRPPVIDLFPEIHPDAGDV